jgi:arginyl-tRNA synthetase
MKENIAKIIDRSLKEYLKHNELSIDRPEISIETPKLTNLGDYSSNIAIKLSRTLKKSPKEIAEGIEAFIKGKANYCERIEIAEQGFINMFISLSKIQDNLEDVLKYEYLSGWTRLLEKLKDFFDAKFESDWDWFCCGL